MPLGQGGYATSSALPGSLESFVGREAILERDRFHGGSSETLEQFEASLVLGAESAVTTASEWAGHLGRGLAILTCILNPGSIVLGGPVAELARHREEDLVRAMQQCLLPDHPMPTLQVSSLGPDAPALGAALMIHKQAFSFDDELVFNGNPAREAMRDGSWLPVASQDVV